MSTHNICFHGELMKIILQLSGNTLLICSTALISTLFQYLSLKHNPLHSLPVAIGNLVQLVELDARSCDLTSLPGTIGQCTSLVSLNIDHNRYKSHLLRYFSTLFRKAATHTFFATKCSGWSRGVLAGFSSWGFHFHGEFWKNVGKMIKSNLH